MSRRDDRVGAPQRNTQQCYLPLHKPTFASRFGQALFSSDCGASSHSQSLIHERDTLSLLSCVTHRIESWLLLDADRCKQQRHKLHL